MRCGMRRGLTLAWALAAVLAVGVGSGDSARADWFHHVIPRETPALDYRTGDVMRAPPIPYGEYAKDYLGSVHGAAGLAAGLIHGGLCRLCGGPACGNCGGLGHHDGHGCGSCGGDGCGHCGKGGLLGGLGHHRGGGLFHRHGAGAGCAEPGCGGGLLGGHGHRHGHGHGAGAGPGALCGPGMPCASGQSAPAPSGQGAMPSGQMTACGACKGHGRIGNGICGLCGGRGLLAGLGRLCGLCGGKGCGSCGGSGMHTGNLCGNCGGKGCSMCGGTGLIHALTGLPHHLMGGVHSAVGMILHRGDIDYFVGPGGPVPLTPGYVPYVVPTRSPRDFFAFPPFTEQATP
jgi:hypothetical protein